MTKDRYIKYRENVEGPLKLFFFLSLPVRNFLIDEMACHLRTVYLVMGGEHTTPRYE